GIVLVVDSKGLLLGTITDGDIRRAVLANVNLQSPIKELLRQKDVRYAKPVTALVESTATERLRLMQEKDIRHLPLLDSDGKVVDLITRDDWLLEDDLPLSGVIMAGGFGTRLRPLTDDLPKPMLPMGDRQLMQRTVEKFQAAGIRNINVTTHYMPEKIMEYFGDGAEFGVDINYVHEDQPLGTAGALGLIQPPAEPLLVINGDILTEVDFRTMLSHHQKHQAMITVAVRQYAFQVPYGVVQCEGAHVRQLQEKPSYNFLVNAGIYLLEPTVYQYIPSNQRFDMTDLIQAVLDEQGTVISFPIVEYWLDIGQHADYEQAQKDLESGKVSS
ncbi:MAG: nucleotidyltransferase family protein, partial [Anaerolineales bacterium]|nr:nucleotidyltransferase family protein [Anaerolineales bacterium]